MENQTPAFVEA